ncbi:hypothetical protein LCGC14_0111540 [marine sediment metagenome]|uniref:Uncharacterized protein n=2 Tax=root TaxID=1 RepID=A0A7V1FMD0_9RHOB|nr:hypothetical protein [Sulfitobacter litoralis]HDZ51556.1 hypothetical protein [Sulfitobacter litoralis]
MFEYSCQTCGKTHDQDNTHHGDYVHGGYGSTKYDETKLVWVAPAPDPLEMGGHICDACIDVQVENGALEAFSSVFSADEINEMSAKGYAKVFQMAADRLYASCVSARGSVPEPVAPLNDEEIEAIADFRSRLCNDPTRSNVISLGKGQKHAKLAWDMGEAHVLAGMILGKIGGDNPDFEAAGVDFGDRLAAFDENTSSLFADMMSSIEADTEDDETTPS